MAENEMKKKIVQRVRIMIMKMRMAEKGRIST